MSDGRRSLPGADGGFRFRLDDIDRIAGLPSDGERLDSLRTAARELLSRGSSRVMLERHARTKDPAALEKAVHAEQEQIRVLEEILNSK